jgi:multidrug efflux pump subunit AcrA (membrane-fusion protein)
VYFEAQVSESNLQRVAVGQRSSIVVPAVTEKPFTGFVSDIIPVADPRLHQFRIRITLPGAPRELTPGAFARGILTTQTIYNTLVVPSDTVIADEGQTALLVAVGEPKKARVDKRLVKVGASANGVTQVLGGVQRGDKVITGNTTLGDGDTVRIATSSS